MNAWLKRCVFNLDLNRESVSELQTLSGSLGDKYEKVLPPLVDFAILSCYNQDSRVLRPYEAGWIVA